MRLAQENNEIPILEPVFEDENENGEKILLALLGILALYLILRKPTERFPGAPTPPPQPRYPFCNFILQQNGIYEPMQGAFISLADFPRIVSECKLRGRKVQIKLAPGADPVQTIEVVGILDRSGVEWEAVEG